MKIVLTIGLVIIFITSFFVMALGGTIVKQVITCEEIEYNPDNYNCRLEKMNMDVFFTLLMTFFFIMADIGAVYLMIKNWSI